MRRMSFILSAVVSVVLLAGTTSPSVGAGADYVVTASASAKELVFGKTVAFKGSVTPKAAGQAIYLQIRYSKTAQWTVEQKRMIASDGTFTLRDTASSLKTRWYRVWKPAASGHAGDVSDTMRVTVWRWHYLTDLEGKYVGRSSGWVDYGVTVAIDGNTYKKSIEYTAYNEGWIEYNLSRKCKTVRATYGLTDDSSSGAQGNVEVLGDGTSKYVRTFDLGQHETKSLGTRNVLRLRIEYAQFSEVDAYPATGSPRVLCRF